MKKIQQVVLAGLLVASLLSCSAFAMSFPDVDSNSDCAAAVESVSELGIMVGDTQGNFNPDKIVSRAEMAAIICRMLGTTENLPKSEAFDDVPTSHWANASIGKAAQLGIVGGYGNGKFGPSDPVTYEQAVTMIIRATGQGDSAEKLGGYPDGFLQTAENEHLLEEIPAAKGQGMTRGAVAMLLHNYYTDMSARPADEHTHHYVEKTVSGTGTGGHYEDVQVQVGTKTANDYAQVTIYGCNACDFTTYDSDEIIRHVDARYAPITSKCWCSTWWWKTTTEVVGTHEEPVYGTRTIWVEDSATTIRICDICGQQQ